MDYIPIKEAAERWGVSEVVARKYCRDHRVPGAVQQNGSWLIPANAKKPEKIVNKRSVEKLSSVGKKLRHQKSKKNPHGLYDYVMINFTYSSCRMASNRLTRNQIESIYRKGKICQLFEPTKVSDMVEAMNHCACIDYILDHAGEPLSHKMIMELHYLLMVGTVDHRKKFVTPGVYRTKGILRRDRDMPPAEEIDARLRELIRNYEDTQEISINEILDFHVQFERIVPFEDGNGRVGRLILFKECVRHGVTPFIIDDKRRSQYLDGLAKWSTDPAILTKVVAEAQARFARQLRREDRRDSPQARFRNYGSSEGESDIEEDVDENE
ncbi:MAG: Fic family protein [Oscillospiraceae bacterium]|nr:Fic family protein [Oscillospiraceae bacterium]